jgi:L-amino acid N-acyltransferase YncA
MLIRDATVDDASAITRVHIASWQTTYVGILPQDYLDSLSYERRLTAWRSLLSDTSSLWFCYVAEDDNGEVIGFAGGEPERSGNTDFTGELGGIYLLKSRQRQGIGRRLTGTVARRLAERGHRSMLLWVLADNPSRLFFEALGGHTVGEREASIAGVSLIEVAYGWRDINLLLPEG